MLRGKAFLADPTDRINKRFHPVQRALQSYPHRAVIELLIKIREKFSSKQTFIPHHKLWRISGFCYAFFEKGAGIRNNGKPRHPTRRREKEKEEEEERSGDSGGKTNSPVKSAEVHCSIVKNRRNEIQYACDKASHYPSHLFICR